MTQTSSSLILGVDEFLTRYGDNPRYELADGELLDRSPPGSHETTAGKIASQLSIEMDRQGHSWVIPRTCLLRPFADVATARRPDVVVLDELALVHEPLWEREPVITLGTSVKLVVEVVSTNWETDYARKVEEYALFGIPEYGLWIIGVWVGECLLVAPSSLRLRCVGWWAKTINNGSIDWVKRLVRHGCLSPRYGWMMLCHVN
jgi:Uma2 family endonuclease